MILIARILEVEGWVRAKLFLALSLESDRDQMTRETEHFYIVQQLENNFDAS